MSVEDVGLCLTPHLFWAFADMTWRMNFYPVWPPIIGMVALFLFARTRLFSVANIPTGGHRGRNSSIDGLRGYLALGVLLFHGAVYHQYLATGRWAGPPSPGYSLLGTGGVDFFFMITAYLFWGRVIDEGAGFSWLQFYVGRLFRIGPLYLVAIAAMVVLVFEQSHWRLQVKPTSFALQVLPWLALGLLGPTDLNNHSGTVILTAGVTWSLQYEWIFYFILPLLAVVSGAGRRRLATVFCVGCCSFTWLEHAGPYALTPGDSVYACLFAMGLACATLERHGWSLSGHELAASAVMAVLLLALFLTSGRISIELQIAMMAAFFFLVASGCSLFGLLKHQASKRLGDVSYGIYLLQGLVLAALFEAQRVRDFASGSPIRHWAVILVGAVLTTLLALLAHVLIERPGVALGRLSAKALASRLNRVTERKQHTRSTTAENRQA